MPKWGPSKRMRRPPARIADVEAALNGQPAPSCPPRRQTPTSTKKGAGPESAPDSPPVPLLNETAVSAITAQVIDQVKSGGLLQQPAAAQTRSRRQSSKRRHDDLSSSDLDSDSDQEMAGLVSGTMANLLEGESIHQVDKPTFQSVGTALGATVSHHIKAKIWANEFVDLDSLLPGNPDDSYTITVARKEGCRSHGHEPLPA